MPYTLSHDREGGCIVVVFKGTVDAGVIREVAPLVARLCEETGCLRILNDMSAATIDMSMMQIFESPRIMDQSSISRTTRRALVVPPDFPETLFLETVTNNRGHNLKVFLDVTDARAWLLGGA